MNDYVRIQPCVNMAETLPVQMVHLGEEYGEACKALKKWRQAMAVGTDADKTEMCLENLGEELTDIKTMAETLLHSLGFNSQDRQDLQRLVNQKNEQRGYW